MTTNQPDRLSRIEDLLQQISTDVQQIKEENEKQRIKLEEEIKRWDLAYQKEKQLLDKSVLFLVLALFLNPFITGLLNNG